MDPKLYERYSRQNPLHRNREGGRNACSILSRMVDAARWARVGKSAGRAGVGRLRSWTAIASTFEPAAANPI